MLPQTRFNAVPNTFSHAAAQTGLHWYHEALAVLRLYMAALLNRCVCVGPASAGGQTEIRWFRILGSQSTGGTHAASFLTPRAAEGESCGRKVKGNAAFKDHFVEGRMQVAAWGHLGVAGLQAYAIVLVFIEQSRFGAFTTLNP